MTVILNVTDGRTFDVSLAELAAVVRQEARGVHDGGRTVELVVHVESVVVVIVFTVAGVVVGQGDLAGGLGGLAEQTFFLDALLLLLELSDLATASVDAVFFVGGDHTQLVDETTLVASVSSSAASVSVKKQERRKERRSYMIMKKNAA